MKNKPIIVIASIVLGGILALGIIAKIPNVIIGYLSVWIFILFCIFKLANKKTNKQYKDIVIAPIIILSIFHIIIWANNSGFLVIKFK